MHTTYTVALCRLGLLLHFPTMPPGVSAPARFSTAQTHLDDAWEPLLAAAQDALHHPRDHTAAHQVERNLQELATWHRSILDTHLAGLGIASDLDHVAATPPPIAPPWDLLCHAWRSLALLRLGPAPAPTDEGQRGLVLWHRVGRQIDKILATNAQFRGRFQAHQAPLSDLDAAHHQANDDDDPLALAWLGCPHPTQSAPQGGTGREILLHQRAQRAAPPPQPAPPCPQWSLGAAANLCDHW